MNIKIQENIEENTRLDQNLTFVSNDVHKIIYLRKLISLNKQTGMLTR